MRTGSLRPPDPALVDPTLRAWDDDGVYPISGYFAARAGRPAGNAQETRVRALQFAQLRVPCHGRRGRSLSVRSMGRQPASSAVDLGAALPNNRAISRRRTK